MTSRFQRQTRFGNPDTDKDKIGNCFSASIATILNISVHDVPVFVASDEWFVEFRNWVRNLGYVAVPFDWADWVEDYLPGCVVEAGGKSPRGDWDHSVVWQIGRGLLWDPHPSDNGLDGPPKTLTLLTPIEPVPFGE